METGASAASMVEHTKSADHTTGCDELDDETVQSTSTVTSLNEFEVNELSTASDKNDSINEGTPTEFHNFKLHVKMDPQETFQDKLSIWHKDCSL
jgi:hypothetical protein